MQTFAAAMRHNMILGQIYTNDIADQRILEAMADIPREPFLSESLKGAAYVDEDIDVGGGRYLMAPLTLARLLDIAAVTPECRVLHIGCLNGYGSAILSRLAAHVVAVDSDTSAVAQARSQMQRLNITNVNLQAVTNMSDGYAIAAPYNVVIIQGAVRFISDTIGSQLAVGGRIATVRNIATRADQGVGLGKGLLVTRLDQKLQYREYFDAACAILSGFEQPGGFVF